MPTTSQIEVSKLKLDLKNFRTVPQKKEADAIKAMISIKPERFYAIIESIIEDGYLPTENIIVLDDGDSKTVREGNRRIAALKLIHGFSKPSDFGLPTSIIDSISELDTKWKSENLKVPCTVYSPKELDKLDKVVALAHGKAEKASRDPWNSVARARHNRDVKNASEHGLDLLEKYLKKGSNINNQQKERWGGDYPITILDEALRKTFMRFGFENVTDLVKKYPAINNWTALEDILLDIGLKQLSFEIIRNPQVDFLTNYGMPTIVVPSVNPTTNPTQPNITTQNTTTPNPANTNSRNTSTPPTPATQNPPPISNTNTSATPTPPKAVAANDPKHVANLLKSFSPRGNNRQKVVTLRDELKKLKIADNPIAFCFILRSMFEISGKAYSSDYSLSMTKSGGKDKTLVEVLRGITAHLTNNDSNTQMVKVLHGAMTEIGKPEGLLSVTSMNNLVHNPLFSIAPSDICILFGNVYPLLEAMN